MDIREATNNDYEDIWKIFSDVIKAGDTYVFSPNTPKGDLSKHWFAHYMKTYVAQEDGEIFGTYIIKPNQIDLGSHIANCSYMVHPKSQGKGVGRLMCSHSIENAKKLGYRAIQFNLVVSTNTAALYIWKKFGFEIIGKIPKAFKNLKLGYVDAYIMFKKI